MKFDRYIGIDAGKSGAIAHISASSYPTVVSMPGTVDDLNEYFSYVKSISECPLACIEKVNVWRTDAEQGKSFGIEKMLRNFNELTTVLRIVKIPFIQIFPVQWQSYLGLRFPSHEERADRKRRLKDIASVRFPSVNVTLTNADALLIMQYLAYKNQREPEWILKQLPESIIKKLEL